MSKSSTTTSTTSSGNPNSKIVCTFTFTECAENHIGNEQIGQKLPAGPSLDDLRKTAANMKSWLTKRNITGWKLELHVFNDKLDAGLLIIKGLNAESWPLLVTAADKKKKEGEGEEEKKDEEEAGGGEQVQDQRSIMMNDLDWDKKFFNSRRKVVQNKNARHNLCFCDTAQDPEYESGKGRTYAFTDLPPFMRSLRNFYSENLLVEGKPLANPLIAEGNKYYDVSSTYIGWHGDVERSIVCGYRIGGPYPLHYWAFDGSTSLTTTTTTKKNNETTDDKNKKEEDLIWSFDMEDGWGYIMSHGASGQNWRKKELHLRHAAGFPSVLAKKQDRVPKSWCAKKGTKATAKAPDTFTAPSEITPTVWEAEEKKKDDDQATTPTPTPTQRQKRGREAEE